MGRGDDKSAADWKEAIDAPEHRREVRFKYVLDDLYQEHDVKCRIRIRPDHAEEVAVIANARRERALPVWGRLKRGSAIAAIQHEADDMTAASPIVEVTAFGLKKLPD